METSPLFRLHITDGYSFRNTIGIIKSETDNATMILSPKNVEITFVNNSDCCIHRIMLNTKEITIYEYNVRDENGKLIPEYPITFDTSQMFNTTKVIGRKDGIVLYSLGNENKINVQLIRTSTKMPGRSSALFVSILNLEFKKYELSSNYNEDPNVRIQSKDFAELCSQINTLKCNKLLITCEQDKMKCEGYMPNNTRASVNYFSNTLNSSIDYSNEVNQVTVNGTNNSKININIIKENDVISSAEIPISTVKALSKIHNISPSGTLIKFYFLKNMPIMLESPIGTYGTYTIFIK